MVRSMGLWLTWCVRPPAWKINGPPHIPGPEELGQAGLLGEKGQPTMAQAGLTLLHSQVNPGTEKLG